LSSNRFGAGTTSSNTGWNQNDLTLAKIMSKFIQMGISIVDYQIAKLHKKKVITQVI
jgi:hypothetical protein